MELAICCACQTVRRAGIRFATAKLSSENVPRNDVNTQLNTLKDKMGVMSIKKPYNSRNNIIFLNYKNYANFKVLNSNTLLSTKYSTCSLKKSSNKDLFARRYLNTVVSPENWLSPQQIEEVLEQSGISFRKGHTGYLTSCQECSTLNKKEYSLFVDLHTGRTVCTYCGKEKSWKEFKDKLSFAESSKKLDSSTDPPIHLQSICPEEHSYWLNSAPINSVSLEVVKSYLSLNDINENVLDSFGVRVAYCEVIDNKASNNSIDGLLFPYYDITKAVLIGFKKIFFKKQMQTFIGNQSDISLFGWQCIDSNQKEVVLTANELDSVAVTYATGVPSLALPNSSLPPMLLPFLEQFDRIIFWFPNNYQSRQNVLCFTKKLNMLRCFTTHKSAENPMNYLIQNGNEAMKKALAECQSMAIDRLLTIKDIGNELFSELTHAKENAGVAFTRFPLLNDFLKGHRRGELTIFTGPTGSGKTTFLSELSLDLCMQGINTLWGSFEIKNVRLANIMLHQYSGIALENHMDKFPLWYENFENLPMYFMSYYGAQDLQCVIKTVEHSVYMYDIEHVIIDNLQFMTTVGTEEDRFQALDKAISLFRKCASELNIHVTIVVHPRKENDDSILQTASIYGTAKATQEADNVLILQRTDNLTMQVKKNRFNGSVGTIPLCFHPDSLCLSGFYRNIDTGEAILPELKPIRPLQNLTTVRKSKKVY